MHDDILWLAELTPESRPLAGSKALELARVARLGLTVPPAFVITTQVHTRLADRAWPEAVVAEIGAALAHLRDLAPQAGGLIVRSSAPFEDAAEFSAAGQLESMRCAFDLGAVLEAVTRCWQVARRAELLAYYRFAGGEGLPRLAVLVQEWIAPEVAGVMFTRGMGPPEQPNALVIEAARESSDAVTSGQAAPARYLVPRGGPLAVPPAADGDSLLDDHRLGLLREAGLRLEADAGAPQDVEWALRGDQLYILQTRPVTVARASQESIYTTAAGDAGTIWVSGFFEERFPDPVSPLTWSYLFPVIEQAALREPLHYLGARSLDAAPILRLYHGRVYTRLAVFQTLYKFFPRLLLPEDARRFFPGGDVRLRRRLQQPRFWRAVWPVLRTMLTEPGWHPLNYRMWQRFVPRYGAALDDQRRALEAASDPAALLTAAAYLRDRMLPLLRLHRWSINYAEVFSTLLRGGVARWTDLNPEEVQTALVAGDASPTLRNDRALRALAGQAAALGLSGEALIEQGPRDPVLRHRMNEFLAEFGHRSFCLDLICPRYQDDPAEVWRVVAEMADDVHAEDAGRRQAGREQVGRGLWEQLHGSRLSRLLPWRWWVVQVLLFFARRYAALREEQRAEWQKALALARRAFTQMETRLLAEGRLRQPGDVFFLRWEELQRWAQGQPPGVSAAQVAERRRDFRRIRYAPTPRFLRGDEPYAVTGTPAAAVDVLHGIGASAGQAAGRARVILSPGSLGDLLAALDEDAVLVTRATDPGWTPVFGRVRAVVMSLGGQLSHGAIVAREYGLPAVVGLGEAVQQIQEGDWLLVDGDQGTVTRLESDPAAGITPPPR